MTPLDAALKAAQNDPERQNEFYTVFLNTEVFVPTADLMGGKEGLRRTGDRETFRPMVVTQDGKDFIPIFDSKERLATWIRRTAPCVGISAHVLIATLGTKAHLALNPGTPFYKEFVPEELEWLLSVLRSQQPQATTVPQGTEVLIASPKELPPQLAERITQALSKSPEVTAAYLPQVAYGGPNPAPQLLLLLRADGANGTVFQAIVKDVTLAMRGLLGPGRFVDIIKYSGSGLDQAILETVKPFYAK